MPSKLASLEAKSAEKSRVSIQKASQHPSPPGTPVCICVLSLISSARARTMYICAGAKGSSRRPSNSLSVLTVPLMLSAQSASAQLPQSSEQLSLGRRMSLLRDSLKNSAASMAALQCSEAPGPAVPLPKTSSALSGSGCISPAATASKREILKPRGRGNKNFHTLCINLRHGEILLGCH